jgi:hypothetical protein
MLISFRTCPTSGVSRGSCKPEFSVHYSIYMYLIWTLNLTTEFYPTKHTDFDWEFSVSPNLDTWFWLLEFVFDMGLMTGVTGLQGMFITPRHLGIYLFTKNLKTWIKFWNAVMHSWIFRHKFRSDQNYVYLHVIKLSFLHVFGTFLHLVEYKHEIKF